MAAIIAPTSPFPADEQLGTTALLNELNISEDLVQSPEHKTAGESKIEDLNDLLPPETPLLLHEDLSEGCGGQLWPAGMVLSKYLLRTQKKALENCSILELGAGGGLVGLAVALGCRPAQVVHITDQLPMLALMNTNIERNRLQSKVKASVYDWGTPVPTTVPHHPDILLAADCVYFEPAFPLLQQTMLDLIGPNTTCYFCFKKRRRADMTFLKAMKKLFNVVAVDDDPDRSTYEIQNLFLFRVSWRPATQ